MSAPAPTAAPPASPAARLVARVPRWLRSWAAAVGLCAFLLHLPYMAPGGPWARKPDPTILSQDEGTVLADSLRITHGEVMYRDFFMFQGPVFYYLNAGVFAVTGPSIAAARLFHLITSAIGAALLALVVARFAGRIAGVSAAAIHVCVLLPMWPFSYPHWLAETFALGALALLTTPTVTRKAELWAGALLGLALMTIQSVGLPVLVALVCVSAAPGLAARDLRLAALRPAAVLGGATVTVGAICSYFALHGALGDLYYAMFQWPMSNYKVGQGDQVTYAWWTKEAIALHRHTLHAPWSTLAVFGLQVTRALPVCALIAAPGVAGWAIWKLVRGRSGFEFALAGGAAVAGVSSLFIAPVRPDLTHVAYLGSFGLIAASLLVAPVRALRGHARHAAPALFALAGLLCFATYAHKTVRTWSPSRKLSTWRGEARRTLPGFKTIEQEAPPDATIVVGSMGGFYYFYLRPPAVPNTYIPATYVKLLSERQWQRVADDIARRRPWAMSFVGKQWSEILKRRPELAQVYKPGGGLLRRLPDPPP